MNIVKLIKKTISSLRNYKDEPTNPLSSSSESLKYKTSIPGNTFNVDEKITDDEDDNAIDNLQYDANRVGKMKLKLLFHQNI